VPAPSGAEAGPAALREASAGAWSGARLGAAPIRTPHTSQKSSLVEA
jgi:hypothetical protein